MLGDTMIWQRPFAIYNARLRERLHVGRFGHQFPQFFKAAVKQRFYRAVRFPQNFTDFFYPLLFEKAQGDHFLIFYIESAYFPPADKKAFVPIQLLLRLDEFGFLVARRNQFKTLLLQFIERSRSVRAVSKILVYFVDCDFIKPRRKRNIVPAKLPELL